MEYNMDNKVEVTKLNNAMQFQNNPEIEVADLDAENILDIKPSYVGKYIVECQVCKQHIYHDTLDITDIEACPYCGFGECFIVVGQVAPVPVSTMVDELKKDEEEKQFTKSELVYGDAIPTESR